MTQATLVDFTKFRKGSKPRGRVIEYCPKCGRKGERTAYRDGMIFFNHAGRVVTGPFPGMEITDGCVVEKGR